MSLTLADLAKKMADIDFTMLQTKTEGGEISGRPMSNNGEVEYDGDSWFFVSESTRVYADIAREPKVNLALQGHKHITGKPGIFVAIEGDAEIIKDKATFSAHWHKELDRWYEDGVDTAGLAMIKVRANRIHYWDGEDQGEVAL